MADGENGSWNDEDATAFTDLMLRQSRQYGVIFMDAEGRITGWNQGAGFITGYTHEEAIGQRGSLLFTPEDRERQLDEHELNTARTVGAGEDERWHVRKDGSRFWSTGLTMPIGGRDGQPPRFVKVFRDATHLRTRMKYLENTLAECSAHQADRDVFVGTIAHELRNPLAPLKTALGLMMRLQDGSDRTSNPLRIMDRQLGFLERLVEDLVDLTRVQAGKLSVAYRTVHLQALLTEALDSCRSTASQRGVALCLVLPPVPIHVEADTDRLHQVVVNLINNAIKFTPHGGSVWLTATADQTHFLFQVKDNGRGISRALLPKIFDVFTQAQDAGSHRGSGLGMGLTIVKEIVSRHKGTIEVRSEGEGKGAEFIVRIPLRRPHGAEPEPMPRGGAAGRG